MIANDDELRITRERIRLFEQRLEDFRKTARPEEFTALSNGYRLEIDRMQTDVLDYLVRPLQAAS